MSDIAERYQETFLEMSRRDAVEMNNLNRWNDIEQYENHEIVNDNNNHNHHRKRMSLVYKVFGGLLLFSAGCFYLFTSNRTNYIYDEHHEKQIQSKISNTIRKILMDRLSSSDLPQTEINEQDLDHSLSTLSIDMMIQAFETAKEETSKLPATEETVDMKKLPNGFVDRDRGVLQALGMMNNGVEDKRLVPFRILMYDNHIGILQRLIEKMNDQQESPIEGIDALKQNVRKLINTELQSCLNRMLVTAKQEWRQVDERKILEELLETGIYIARKYIQLRKLVDATQILMHSSSDLQ